MKIGFCSIGRVVRLKKIDCKKWNGSMEPYNMLWSILRSDKIDIVYLLGPNDYHLLKDDEKKEIDPYNKLVDVFNQSKKIIRKKLNKNEKLSKKNNEYLYDYWIKFINDYIDYCLCISSTSFIKANLYEFVKKEDGNYYRPLDMSNNYSGPIVYFLNKTKFKWYMFTSDPRNIQGDFNNLKYTHYDVRNLPIKILSQVASNATWKRIVEGSLGVPEYIKIPQEYCYFERFCAFNTPPRIDEEKNIKFTLVAMQNPGKGSLAKDFKNDWRLLEIKKYILDEDLDIDIWGYVDEWVKEKYKQFKGLIDHYELNDKLAHTKYTFIIPIKKGWVSAKYLETLIMGVIPFFHPDYDTNCHIIPKDHFCRVKDGKELKEKIELLESNENMRKELFREMYDTFVGNYLQDPTWFFDFMSKETGEDWGKFMTIETKTNKIRTLF